MEDVKKVFALPSLSEEDKIRINNCYYYEFTKKIINSAKDNADFEVGSAVFIRRISDKKFVGQEYNSADKADKYLIVHNDEGFVFAKKICANGKPGVSITCLTIDYPTDSYYLESDGDYVEAVLLDNQDNYDPLASAKDYVKKKNKATRENSKKRLIFPTFIEALAFLKTVKVGDTFYRADYAYGSGVTEYIVGDIIRRKPIPPVGDGWSRKRNDEEYIDRGLDEVIIVKLDPVKSTNNCMFKCDLDYDDIAKEGYARLIFKEKPISPEDIL